MRSDSIVISITSDAAPVRVFGLDLITAAWLPDGIAVVTANAPVDDGFPEWIRFTEPAVGSGVKYTPMGESWKDYFVSGTYTTSSDFTVPITTLRAEDLYESIKALSIGFDPAKPAKPAEKKQLTTDSKAVIKKPPNPPWVDPESIYGKALARAREASKKA